MQTQFTVVKIAIFQRIPPIKLQISKHCKLNHVMTLQTFWYHADIVSFCQNR